MKKDIIGFTIPEINSNFLKNKLIWLPSPFTLKLKEQMKVCSLINNFIEQNL